MTRTRSLGRGPSHRRPSHGHLPGRPPVDGGEGHGRTHNTRLSQQVRGQIADRMRHLAAETGIAVVTVPARNTSKHCPHCLTPLRHRKAPDRPTAPGWKWAICPNPQCGWQGDRDQGAWRRIAARGLAHQTKTITDPTTATMAIRTIVDAMETRAVITPKTTGKDRSKTGPTRHRSPRPAPRRRRAPSPARHQPGWPASGGTRHNGPAPAPRRPPVPGRDDDRHTHPPAQAARGGARRGLPPARPRHPATMGNNPTDPATCGSHRIP